MQPNQPSNGILGDSSPLDLPQKPVDDLDISELRNKAKYTRSKEYKDLKAKADAKIAFYQRYLPNGMEVGIDVAPSAEDWRVANRVIAEFNMLFSEHESADDQLKDINVG